MASLPGMARVRMRRVGATVENPLTFTSGLTRTGDTVTNDLVTGLAGSLNTVNGGVLTTDSLTIKSANNAGTLTGPITMVAGEVELRQGVNPSILRVYNTYTSAGANFERAAMSWSSNQLTIGAQASGTGTLRDVFFVGNSFTFANTLAASVSKGTPIGTSSVPFGTIFANRFEAPATTIGVVLSGDATNINFTGNGTQAITKVTGTLFIQTSDANDIAFSTNGSGNEAFRLSNASGGRIALGTLSRAANGSVATVLGSLGPVGSHTTVQEWLTVQSNGLASQRWIPMF